MIVPGNKPLRSRGDRAGQNLIIIWISLDYRLDRQIGNHLNHAQQRFHKFRH